MRLIFLSLLVIVALVQGKQLNFSSILNDYEIRCQFYDFFLVFSYRMIFFLNLFINFETNYFSFSYFFVCLQIKLSDCHKDDCHKLCVILFRLV